MPNPRLQCNAMVWRSRMNVQEAWISRDNDEVILDSTKTIRCWKIKCSSCRDDWAPYSFLKAMNDRFHHPDFDHKQNICACYFFPHNHPALQIFMRSKIRVKPHTHTHRKRAYFRPRSGTYSLSPVSLSCLLTVWRGGDAKRRIQISSCICRKWNMKLKKNNNFKRNKTLSRRCGKRLSLIWTAIWIISRCIVSTSAWVTKEMGVAEKQADVRKQKPSRKEIQVLSLKRIVCGQARIGGLEQNSASSKVKHNRFSWRRLPFKNFPPK